MTSLLESSIRKTIAKEFRGKLLRGALRRTAHASLDSYGDPVAGASTTWAFEGMVGTFNAAFAAAAGIPVTDAKVLIIAGSVTTTPEKDDQVKLRSTWYQLRQLTAQDPANATYEYAAFQIADPT